MFDDVIQKKNAYHKGWQAGFDEGVLEAMRQGVLDIVQTCFPEIEELARRQTVALEDATILRRLLLHIFTAQSVEDAERCLLEEDQVLRKGFEEGLRQERFYTLRRLRQVFLGFIEVRFPELLPLAKRCVKAIQDPELLQNLSLRVFPLFDANEVENHLLRLLDLNQPEMRT